MTARPALCEQEQVVARRLSGGFAWPTVLLTAALLEANGAIIQGTGADPHTPIQL